MSDSEKQEPRFIGTRTVSGFTVTVWEQGKPDPSAVVDMLEELTHKRKAATKPAA